MPCSNPPSVPPFGLQLERVDTQRRTLEGLGKIYLVVDPRVHEEVVHVIESDRVCRGWSILFKRDCCVFKTNYRGTSRGNVDFPSNDVTVCVGKSAE